MIRKMILSLLFGTALLASTGAATPDWTENFSGLTGSPYDQVYSGTGLLPQEIMAGLTVPSGATGTWLAGVRAAGSTITLETGASTITAGNVPTGDSRLIFDTTPATTNDDAAVFSPVSTGANGKWKYDVYIAFANPSSAGQLGNFIVGVSPKTTTGATVWGASTTDGVGSAPLFQLQVGNSDVNHTWRVINPTAGGSIAASLTPPSIPMASFGGQWVKVSLECEIATKTIKGYLNDSLDWTYDFSALDTTTWNLNDTVFGIRAYPAMLQRAYVANVSYSGFNVTSAVTEWMQF